MTVKVSLTQHKCRSPAAERIEMNSNFDNYARARCQVELAIETRKIIEIIASLVVKIFECERMWICKFANGMQIFV